MRTWKIVTLALVALGQLGCAGSRKSGLCEDMGLKPTKTGDLAAVEAQAAEAWKARKDQVKLEEAIKHLREAIAIDPKKAVNYVQLSRALYFWADGYLRFDDDREDDMLKAFEEAIQYAEMALKLQNADFQLSSCARDPFKTTVRTIRKKDVEAVYWYAAALGKYGLAKGILVVLENKDKIFEMVKAVRRLDQSFWYGAADRYLGAYYTKVPVPKGDPKKSLKHFRQSLKIAPNYLATRVLMAERLAPLLKDRKMFQEQLQYVLDAPVDTIPGFEAEAIIEKKKAKRLMEDLDTIFPLKK